MTNSLQKASGVESDKPRLGQLLVEVGLLSVADLEEALAKQRKTGLPLGHVLVEGGYVAGHSVAMALADQHGGLLKTEYGFATGWSPAHTVEGRRPEQRTPSAAGSESAEAAATAAGLRVVQPTPATEPRAQTDAALADLRTRNEELEAQLRALESAAPATENPGRQRRSSRRWRLWAG